MASLTDNQLKKLHLKYVTKGKYDELFVELIWTHSKIVLDVAENLSELLATHYGISVDAKTLRIGALIHDIGVYSCFDELLRPTKEYIQHGLLGYEILKTEGFEEKYCRFALCHTGVGILKENIIANKLPLPHKDFIPITLEEELICYSDNFHTKAPTFLDYSTIMKSIEIDFPGDVSRLIYMKEKFGIPDLELIKDKYRLWHEKVEAFRKSNPLIS